MKIGYFADGPWSHQAFERIISDASISVGFVIARTDTQDNTLQRYANEYNIPYHKGINVNSDEFYKLASSYNCDLFVSMSFNQIFRHRIINLPKYSTINCHAGKLPFYRGRNILNWALINDEKDFGITVHYINEGIDTGDIILQRSFIISDSDSYKTLLKLAYTECANILYDSIKLLQKGEVNLIKQSDIHPIGFYCGPRRKGDELIDWHQNSRDIFNFIRAICKPGPLATTYLNSNKISINNSNFILDAPKYKGIPGQIVGKTEFGFVVKTLDSTIEILEIEKECEIKIGDRLGK